MRIDNLIILIKVIINIVRESITMGGSQTVIYVEEKKMKREGNEHLATRPTRHSGDALCPLLLVELAAMD